MDGNNEQKQNVGDPTDGDGGAADPGTPPVVPAVDPIKGEGTPGDSGGEQPDERDATIATQKSEIKKLNRAVVNARRGGQANQGGAEYTKEVLDTPEGQYAASLEIATGRLRAGLEDRLKEYPEISEDEKNRIRNNPWAFAGQQSYMAGNWQLGLDEIELKLVDRIDELEAQKNKPAPQGNTTEQPANVTGNPVPEGQVTDAETGSEEDTDLWTMPMDKLEKLAAKQQKELAQTK